MKRSHRLVHAALSFCGVLILLLMIALGWAYREPIGGLLRFHSSRFATAFLIFLVFSLLLPPIEWLQVIGVNRTWRTRLIKQERMLIPRSRVSGWRRLVAFDPLERLSAPFFHTKAGQMLASNWYDAGFGSKPGRFLAAITAAVVGGYLFGFILTRRPILGFFSAFIFLVGLLAAIFYRARLQRRRFGDQLPDMLERLADSLQAGFSLIQAIEFVHPALPEPSASELAQVARQTALGLSVDDALAALLERRPSEDVRFLVEGLTLQRQVGGNMALLMRELAGFMRSRVTLENEVRTLTAQGRLSAIVIALLVPFSVGLLSFFPGYVDILFQTDIGNMVLVAAGILELIGTGIILRVIRLEF